MTFGDINGTYLSSFPYTMKFEDRVTPAGFTVTPTVTLFTPDGEVIATNTDATFIVKVNTPQVFKYLWNSDNVNMMKDGMTVYGGALEGDRIAADGASDVVFSYNTSQVAVTGSGWHGNGLNRTPMYEKIVLTDRLPEHAFFDPAKNPGWTKNPDDTVSYTETQEGAPSGKGAEANVKNVKLVLSFPGAPINITLINTVTMVGTPVNADMVEESVEQTVSDTLKFKLDGTLVRLMGFAEKDYFLNHNVPIDYGSMHLKFSKYWIRAGNNNSYPIGNVVLIDGPMDDRYYFRSIQSLDGFDQTAVQGVYGVLADETEELIWDNSATSLLRLQTILDKITHDKMLANVASVEAGQLAEEDSGVTRRYEKLKLVFAPGYTLNPGDKIGVLVELGFNDPYGLRIADGATMSNHMTSKGTLMTPAGLEPMEANDSASNTLEPMEEMVSAWASVEKNVTGLLDEQIDFKFTVELNGLGKARRFVNPKVIALLPEGVTINPNNPGYLNPDYKEGITHVMDYGSTGRQAVIFDLKDFKVADATVPLSTTVWARINENAKAMSEADWAKSNEVQFYFFADNWQALPEGVISYAELPDPLNLDLDGDGHTDDQLIGATTYFRYDGTSVLQGVKRVKGPNNADFLTNAPALVPYDSPFAYDLEVQNGQDTPLQDMWIYDVLPYKGDKEYFQVDGAYPDRESAFKVTLTGPVVNPDATRFLIKYRLDDPAPVDPYDAFGDTTNWVLADDIMDWSKVTAFGIRLMEEETIKGNERVHFRVDAKSPDYVQGEGTNRRRANNNFALSLDGKTFGSTNTVQTGLTITIPVEKQWEGGDPATHEPVTIDLYRNGEVVDAQSKILSAENQWIAEFENLPILSPVGLPYDYSVQEREIPQHYNVSYSGNDTDGYVILNTYASPQISITGTWIGDTPTADEGLYMLLSRRVVGTENWETVGNAVPLHTLENYSFTNMNDQFDKDGAAYEFKVDMVAHAEAQEPLSGFVIGTEKETGADGAVSAWHFTAKKDSPVSKPKTSLHAELRYDDKAWAAFELLSLNLERNHLPYVPDAAHGETLQVLEAPDAQTYAFHWRDLVPTDEQGEAYIFSVSAPEVPQGYDVVSEGGDGSIDHPFVFVIRSIDDTKPTPKPRPDHDDNDDPTGGIAPQPPTDPNLEERAHLPYIFGYPDDTFGADRPITRGEAAAILARIDTGHPVIQPAAVFPDVVDKAWYHEVIAHVSARGIMSGYPDESFLPDAPITRGEVASVLDRFAGLTTLEDTRFSDIQNHWAQESVEKATLAGFIAGYPDGTFRPDHDITRAEFVAMTNRMLRRIPDEAFIDGRQLLPYTDINNRHWGYYEVMEASVYHIYAVEKNLEHHWVSLQRNDAVPASLSSR